MTVRGILLDIEGTTSSISFVHDQMFPFARKALPEYLDRHWDKPELAATLDLLAMDLGQSNAADWLGSFSPVETQKQQIISAVNQLMDADVKATGLKKLQGMVWQQGFDSGQLVAHVWPDVPEAIQTWKEQGIDLRIYSSGSVAAQKLFFGHSEFGDLLPHFSGHYDTTIGGKKEVASYHAIAADWGLPPHSILFLSDIADELRAAKEAGFQVCLSLRPGNTLIPDVHDYPTSSDFRQLENLAN